MTCFCTYQTNTFSAWKEKKTLIQSQCEKLENISSWQLYMVFDVTSKSFDLSVMSASDSTDVTTDIAVFTKPSEVHLSQEECGLKLIIKDEIKVGDNPSHLQLEQETMFG